MTTSRFFLEPPLGFRGFDCHQSITYYERNLPHWRQEGATYAVTFRLADSLPQNKLRELKALRSEFDSRMEGAVDEHSKNTLRAEFASQSMSKSEVWLDHGYGECLLRISESRERLRRALLFFNEERYEMGAYVIMPNHVHAIMRPFDGFSLEKILHSIKRASSKEINFELGRRGPLWQEESHDRIIRNGEHLWRTLQYIGKNPEKSGLGNGEELRWVSEQWRSCGWDFVVEDE